MPDDNESVGDLQATRFAMAQWDDPWLAQIIMYLEKSTFPNDTLAAQQVVTEAAQMEMSNGLLCSYWWTAWADQCQNTRLQIVVPQVLVDQVLWAMHDDVLVGHLGEKSKSPKRTPSWHPAEHCPCMPPLRAPQCGLHWATPTHDRWQLIHFGLYGLPYQVAQGVCGTGSDCYCYCLTAHSTARTVDGK